MNRNKRIIDCTPLEILDLGKKLIDYYFEKNNQLMAIPTPPYYDYSKVTCTTTTPQFKEGEIICQDQKEL